MINNSGEAIKIIKEAVSRVLPGSRIIFFGSRARGDHDHLSDFDFLIVTEKTLPLTEKKSIKSILRKKLAKEKIPADILINSQEEVDINKEFPGHIIRQVLKEGITI